MATRARSISNKILKCIAFIGVFVLSLRFVNIYPHPMSDDYQHEMFLISSKLGVKNPENFYLSVELIVNLVAASIEYALLSKLYGKIREDTRNTEVPRETGLQAHATIEMIAHGKTCP